MWRGSVPSNGYNNRTNTVNSDPPVPAPATRSFFSIDQLFGHMKVGNKVQLLNHVGQIVALRRNGGNRWTVVMKVGNVTSGIVVEAV